VQNADGLALDKASDMASDCGGILKYPEVSYVGNATGRNDDGPRTLDMSHIEARWTLSLRHLARRRSPRSNS